AWLRAPARRQLLDSLAEALVVEDLEEVFGLALDHGRDEIPLADDEVLLEETFTHPRRLLLRPAPLGAALARSTPTGWSVRDGEVIMRCTCQTVDGRHNHFETN